MKKISGAEKIRREIPDILHDESRFESGTPSVVCFPENADDLTLAIEQARTDNAKVTFVGGQTGTTGGAVPEDNVHVIAFSAMKRIHALLWENDRGPVLIADPGISLDSIDRFLMSPAAWPYKVPGSEELVPGAYFYPPDPTEMTAHLGGTVATNASGARSFRFGATRPHIASLGLVLSNGNEVLLQRSQGAGTWDGVIRCESGERIQVPPLPYESPAIKNAAGYYSSPSMVPADLFIGSEGTLAAIARVGISLQPRPEILSGLTFFTGSDAAFDFADFLRKEPSIAAIEFFDHGSLRFIDRYRYRLSEKVPSFPPDSKAAILWEYIETESDPFEGVMERWEKALLSFGSSFDATWSGFDDAEKHKLHLFRHALPEMVNSVIAENKRSCRDIRKIGTDSAFAAEAFPAAYDETMRLIAESNLEFVAFGHLGNYHLHINLIPANAGELDAAFALYDRLMTIAIERKGTVSAEHGVGKIKKKYLRGMYGDEGVAAMRRVKTALDPEWMLNPGNLFDY